MKRSRDDNRIVFQSFAMVLQFGLNMIVPIGMMTALGIWLDGKLGTSVLTIVLFMAGAAAGAQNIYRMARGMCGGEEEDMEQDISDENSGELEKDEHDALPI